MKKQKHGDEIQEVKDTEVNPDFSQNTETTDQAADQIIDEIDQMKQQLIDMNDKNLRLMAEFDNYRKRTLKERIDLIKTAGDKILSEMLPLVDDF